MRHKLGLLSSLGLSFISTLTWGEETSTVLETIRVQAESTREDVSQNSSATKFTHDVLDVLLTVLIFLNKYWNSKTCNGLMMH